MQLEWYYRACQQLGEALAQNDLGKDVKMEYDDQDRHPTIDFFVPINELDEGDIILRIYFDPYNQEFYFKGQIDEFEAKLKVEPIWGILEYAKECYEDYLNEDQNEVDDEIV